MPIDHNSEEYKAYRREISRKHRLAHPEKKMARIAGQVIQKKPCRDCLKLGITNMEVEAHHPDYSKPWDVIWLCKKHHELEDMKKDAQAKLIKTVKIKIVNWKCSRCSYILSEDQYLNAIFDKCPRCKVHLTNYQREVIIREEPE